MDTTTAATTEKPEKVKTVWLVGVDPAPEPGMPFRDDLGRVWHPIKEGSQTYTFDGRHFETLPDLHMRTDLFLTA